MDQWTVDVRSDGVKSPEIKEQESDLSEISRVLAWRIPDLR